MICRRGKTSNWTHALVRALTDAKLVHSLMMRRRGKTSNWTHASLRALTDARSCICVGWVTLLQHAAIWNALLALIDAMKEAIPQIPPMVEGIVALVEQCQVRPPT